MQDKTIVYKTRQDSTILPYKTRYDKTRQCESKQRDTIQERKNNTLQARDNAKQYTNIQYMRIQDNTVRDNLR